MKGRPLLIQFCRPLFTEFSYFRIARHSGTIAKVSGKATSTQAETESGPSLDVAKA